MTKEPQARGVLGEDNVPVAVVDVLGGDQINVSVGVGAAYIFEMIDLASFGVQVKEAAKKHHNESKEKH
eukprot:271526-Rhodomonas_salina.2